MQRTTRRERLDVLGSRPKHVAKLRLELVADRHDLAELVNVLLRGLFKAANTVLLVRLRAHDNIHLEHTFPIPSKLFPDSRSERILTVDNHVQFKNGAKLINVGDVLKLDGDEWIIHP